MRVLIINSFYAPDIRGGAEYSVKKLAEGLQSKGHTVRVLCLGDFNTEEIIDGIEVVRFKPSCAHGPNEIVSNGVDGYIVPPFDISMFAEKLKVLIKDDKLRAHFTEDSQRNMYQFSKNKIVANWVQLLEELTE